MNRMFSKEQYPIPEEMKVEAKELFKGTKFENEILKFLDEYSAIDFAKTIGAMYCSPRYELSDKEVEENKEKYSDFMQRLLNLYRQQDINQEEEKGPVL